MTEVPYGKILALYRIGVITHSDLIKWADSVIDRFNSQDEWFIDLSTSSNLHKLDVESILQERATEGDTVLCKQDFLASMALLYYAERRSPKDIVSMLYEEVCLSELGVYEDLKPSVYRIDDLFDWDVKQGLEELKAFMEGYRDRGNQLVKNLLC